MAHIGKCGVAAQRKQTCDLPGGAAPSLAGIPDSCYLRRPHGQNEPFGTAEVWEGVLDIGTAKLRLVLKVAPSSEGLVGRLDSLDQNAMNMPVDTLVHDGSKLRFEMKAIEAVYEGTMQDDGREIAGQWTQRGRAWPLVLSKV
jgi:hypothetical protein